MPPARAYVPPVPPLPTGPLTAAQLPDVRIPGKHVELVRGTLVVKEPPGYRHSTVTARLAKALMDHVDPRDLGDVGLRRLDDGLAHFGEPLAVAPFAFGAAFVELGCRGGSGFGGDGPQVVGAHDDALAVGGDHSTSSAAAGWGVEAA